MRNKDCKVVQDLLPNYIEKLTSEETNKFIEEHLQECPECKAMLESMKAEIKINTAKQDDREVEYIKKFNVKFKKVEYKLFVLIYTIIAILIVGTLGFFGRRYVILKDLSSKLSQYEEIDNYYVKVGDYNNNQLTFQETWVKGERVRMCFSHNDINDWQTILKDGKYYWYWNGELREEHTAEEGDVEFLYYLQLISSEFQKQFSDIKTIFTHSIETLKLNDKVCYKIKADNVVGSYIYFEKDTGLPIKSEYWEIGELAGETRIKSSSRNYEFKFYCVKESDLKLDDGTEYEFEEVTKTAKLGENANIIDGNLNIEISNLAYDEAKDEFITDIKFSTIDNKGLSSYIVYDYIIYDANCKIVASSIPIGMTPEKRAIAERFAIKNYNSTNYADFMSNMIGVAEQRTNMSEDGIVHQTLTVPNLDQKLNLENLNVLITNIKYKNKGEPETIEPEKDYIFTFN